MLRLGLRRGLTGIIAALAGTLAAVPAFAQEPTIDTGSTAWMITATALVLLMTIPGLALFYGGMVRKMNVLAIVMQSFAICCLVSILWMVVGYTIAFTEGNSFIGNFSNFLLKSITVGSISGAIPETVFMLFQATFAIITPALITGAFADRMKFSAMLIFIGAWSVLIYAPLTHMVWMTGGLMFDWGVLDFAGGTVVHISSGISGLVAALMIGKRNGYRKVPFVPHNLVLTVIGGSLLWVDWFGFNAGSALAASPNAGMAMVVTHMAAAAAALAWMFCEWGAKGQPSVLGIVSGAVAGLVGITPASGFVDPLGAIVIGVAAGVGCFFASTFVKNKLGYDDALDAFGVHGIGGTIGALLTGVFATMAVKGGDAAVGLIDGNAAQVWIQLKSIIVTMVFCGVGTAIILKVIDLVVGLRVPEEVERDGLDLALHGEAVQ
ncbi:MAG TPA: ammonium transporter [Dongiaceae bacterium]|nr:ammonium transporter [Dongiaceae bacterium]